MPSQLSQRVLQSFYIEGRLCISETTAEKQDSTESLILENKEQMPRRQEPSPSKTCSKIICNFSLRKQGCVQKGTRTSKSLTQWVDLCLDASIRKAAIATDDSRIIGLTSQDLVAVGACYYGQCF